MKNKPLLILLCMVVLLISCNAQPKKTVEFFVKYKANNVAYQILFAGANDGYDDANNSTTANRKFKKPMDTVTITNGQADFRFEFYKRDNPLSYKTIVFKIEKILALVQKNTKSRTSI